MCSVSITRQRKVESKIEKAILDFFLVNEKILPFLEKMIIDERREYPLSNFAQQKRHKRVTETDHNGMILEVSIQFSNRKPHPSDSEIKTTQF